MEFIVVAQVQGRLMGNERRELKAVLVPDLGANKVGQVEQVGDLREIASGPQAPIVRRAQSRPSRSTWRVGVLPDD